MDDKKMYVFNTQTGYNSDVVVIFATSFDEAVLIYSRERPKDYATQSIHFYGVFDEDQTDQKSVKEKFDDYKDRWEICKKEPMDTDEYGTIKSRTYSGKPYGDYDFRITVTELPIEEFQVICNICNTEEDDVFDRVAIMKNAKIELNDIYHTDPVSDEAIRIKSSIYTEAQTIKELIDTRMKYKREMFDYPSDSEEYKAAKKKVDELKKEINRRFSEDDDMMINFKEKGNE